MPKKKLDLYAKHAKEYAATQAPRLVTTRPARYFTVTGKGKPGDEVFQSKIGALYAVAYTVKFTKKFAGRDYGVCKLEALWWGKRKGTDFSKEPKNQWNWKLLIRTPSFVTEKDRKRAVEVLEERGKGPEVARVRLETLDEGRCVQALHVGPYDRERETMARMIALAKEKGFSLHGLHHEIYLSDPRRVAPPRLKTILRHPVRARRSRSSKRPRRR